MSAFASPHGIKYLTNITLLSRARAPWDSFLAWAVGQPSR
jgi:hypothetical protein